MQTGPAIRRLHTSPDQGTSPSPWLVIPERYEVQLKVPAESGSIRSPHIIYHPPECFVNSQYFLSLLFAVPGWGPKKPPPRRPKRCFNEAIHGQPQNPDFWKRESECQCSCRVYRASLSSHCFGGYASRHRVPLPIGPHLARRSRAPSRAQRLVRTPGGAPQRYPSPHRHWPQRQGLLQIISRSSACACSHG